MSIGNKIHARVWGKLAAKNWTTWIDHLAVAWILAGLSAFFGWGRVVATIAAIYYVGREVRGYRKRGGGKVLDSLMDAAGPVLLAVLWWLL